MKLLSDDNAPVYHWYKAEQIFFNKAIRRHNMNWTKPNWVDLHELYTTLPIVIAGMHSFQLKEITRALRSFNLVEKSYEDFLEFLKNSYSKNKYEMLLVSGSNKKKNFDTINVLNKIKKEKILKIKLGIAYNPYLKKYYSISSERERFERKISTGLINSIWFQYGTDIKVLQNELTYLKKILKNEKLNLFGSLFIPSKQFIARFKFRPWKEVYISEKCLFALDNFFDFTSDLVSFYKNNNITPVIESDFSSSDKLDAVYSFLENER